MCNVSCSNKSYDCVNSDLKIKKIIDVSSKTLITRTNFDYKLLDKLNKNLINFIYTSNKINTRFIAVDGSICYIPLVYSNNGYHLSQNKSCCKVLISGLVDVDTKIPINYGINKSMNERNALVDQFKFLNKSDVLVLDRGYYSIDMLGDIYNNKLNAIFRLRSDLSILKNFGIKNDIITEIKLKNKSIKFRLIRFTIGNQYYYIGTTLIDKKQYNIDFFKIKYHQRWNIETNFRHLKYDLHCDQTNVKCENKFKLNILSSQFIFILATYFEYKLRNNIKIDTKINTKNTLKIMYETILYNLLYNKPTVTTINTLIDIFKIIIKFVTKIIQDRVYDRVRKRPMGKWTSSGGTSGNNR